MSEIRVDAVLLTGTIGAGKTALAVELGDVLGGRGHATAVLDLDWLGWFHPAPGATSAPADLIVRNLRSIWPNFRAEGVRYLVMARMIQTPAEVNAIRDALDGVSLTVVRVSASEETIEARLRARDTGAELAEHLRELALVNRGLDEMAIEDLSIENEGRLIRAVAEDVLDRLAWI